MAVIIYDKDETSKKFSEMSNGQLFRYTTESNVDEYYIKCQLIFGQLNEYYVLSLKDFKLYKAAEKFPDVEEEFYVLKLEKMQWNFTELAVSSMTDKTAVTTLGTYVFIADVPFISSIDILDGYYTLVRISNGMIMLYDKESIDASNGTSLVIHGFNSDMIDLYVS